MIVGFQVLLIGLLADVISGNRKLLEDLLYRVRSLELPRRASRARPRRSLTRAGRPRRAAGSADVADPAAVSIVIPAFNEADVDRRRRRVAARARRRGARSSSSTTGRPTAPARARPRAGATVVRHPYNKGNGAAVKSGIRRATGEYVLIIDGDGQHPPRTRCGSRRGSASTTWSSARVGEPRRRRRRGALGNGALNRLASYLTGRDIPDLTSGFRARAPRVPARVPAPAAERLLDADDDDAGVHQGGLQRRVRADRGAAARRAARRSGSRATARSSCDHPARSSRSSARCGSSCRSASASFALGAAYAVWTIVDAVARHQLVGAADHARGDRVSRRAGLGADLGAALRRPAVTRMTGDRRARLDRRVRRSPACCCGWRSAALLDRQAAHARRARVPGARAQRRARARVRLSADEPSSPARGSSSAARRLSAVSRGHRRRTTAVDGAPRARARSRRRSSARSASG